MPIASSASWRTMILILAMSAPSLASSDAVAQQPRQPATPAQTAEAAEDPRPAPSRRAGEGDGPFQRLIIRGATLIDGSGGPPRGPVDIVVEGNKIVEIAGVGVPKVPINPNRRPTGAVKEIDATGMYVMPGLVDTHVHMNDPGRAEWEGVEHATAAAAAGGTTTVIDITARISRKEYPRALRSFMVSPWSGQGKCRGTYDDKSFTI